MLRTRLANAFIIVVGAIFVSIAAGAIGEMIRGRGDGCSPALSVFFGAFGAWCVVGGFRNLRELRRLALAGTPLPPLSKSARVARWLTALSVAGLIVTLANFAIGDPAGSRLRMGIHVTALTVFVGGGLLAFSFAWRGDEGEPPNHVHTKTAEKGDA